MNSIKEQISKKPDDVKSLIYHRFMKKPSFIERNQTPDMFSNRTRRTTVSRGSSMSSKGIFNSDQANKNRFSTYNNPNSRSEGSESEYTDISLSQTSRNIPRRHLSSRFNVVSSNYSKILGGVPLKNKNQLQPKLKRSSIAKIEFSKFIGPYDQQ